MNGTFQIKDDQLLQYFHKVKQLITQFKSVDLKYIPREENRRADKLSKLTTGKEKGQLSSLVCQIVFRRTIDCMQVSCIAEQDDWRRAIMLLIKKQGEGIALRPKEAKQIARYVIVGEELYRRGYVTPMLKSLSKEESEYVMRELHGGICSRHNDGCRSSGGSKKANSPTV